MAIVRLQEQGVAAWGRLLVRIDSPKKVHKFRRNGRARSVPGAAAAVQTVGGSRPGRWDRRILAGATRRRSPSIAQRFYTPFDRVYFVPGAGRENDRRRVKEAHLGRGLMPTEGSSSSSRRTVAAVQRLEPICYAIDSSRVVSGTSLTECPLHLRGSLYARQRAKERMTHDLAWRNAR